MIFEINTIPIKYNINYYAFTFLFFTYITPLIIKGNKNYVISKHNEYINAITNL